MYEIGLSTPGFINEQLFSDMADAGIKHIEISVDKRHLHLRMEQEVQTSKSVKIWLLSYYFGFKFYSIVSASSICISRTTAIISSRNALGVTFSRITVR